MDNLLPPRSTTSPAWAHQSVEFVLCKYCINTVLASRLFDLRQRVQIAFSNQIPLLLRIDKAPVKFGQLLLLLLH
jgi:hypothetical protein